MKMILIVVNKVKSNRETLNKHMSSTARLKNMLPFDISQV